MKGIFITIEDMQKVEIYSGINKKIRNQVEVFNAYGMNCKLLRFSASESTCFNKLAMRLPYFNIGPSWKYNKKFEDADYIYVRRPYYFSHSFIKLLMHIKKRNRFVKILLEIPTYPYDSELSKRLLDLPLLIKDRYNRRYLKKFVDKIVCVGKNKIIFGIQCINIINGIKIENLDVINKTCVSDTINLIAVAYFTKFHGYERILYGLIQYYKNGGKRKIVLHVVGEGQELKKYLNITNNSIIVDKVKYYGLKNGADLDEIYSKCDIGICSLAMHRKKIEISSELKSREYLMKGLPIISSSRIDIFEDKVEKSYFLKLKNGEEAIDIENVIKFYDRIYKTKDCKDNVKKKIIDFAKENIDILNTMKPVINYIQREKGL